MPQHKKTVLGSLIASVLSILGCSQSATPPNDVSNAPKLVATISVKGFDSNGEPVIKKWSDGTIGIHFEAMPPFFAEDNGTEEEFENFESKLEEVLGVVVHRDDREVFLIKEPNPDTAEKAKAWLEVYHETKNKNDN